MKHEQCDTSCMECSEPQKYKVNHASYHGYCEDHKKNPFCFEKCKHCQSVVPILENKEMCVDCTFCKINEVYSPVCKCGSFVCNNCYKFSRKCPGCCPIKETYIFDPQTNPLPYLEIPMAYMPNPDSKLSILSRIKSLYGKPMLSSKNDLREQEQTEGNSLSISLIDDFPKDEIPNINFLIDAKDTRSNHQQRDEISFKEQAHRWSFLRNFFSSCCGNCCRRRLN